MTSPPAPAGPRSNPTSPCFECPPGVAGTEYKQYSGRTDGAGTHYLQIDFDSPEVDLPSTVTAEATVQDVNRQAWSSRTSLLVHAARYYVGLRSDRTFVEQGTPIRYDAVVTDVDGNLVPGRTITVTAGRVEWGYENGQSQEQLVDEQECTLTSTADATDGSMRCEFPTTIGGTYRITAVVADDTGHRNRTQTTTWVSGGTGLPTRDVAQEQVTIVPDRETYAPGETAELLVQAPFAPATGLMTVIKRGIVSTQRFDAADGSAVLQIPVDDGDVPNVVVQIDMVGTTRAHRRRRHAAPRLAAATGVRNRPDHTRRPAGDAGADRDGDTRRRRGRARHRHLGDGSGDRPDGAPVSDAAVAVVVVDEAVLALTGYQLADPLDVFYADLWSTVTSTYYPVEHPADTVGPARRYPARWRRQRRGGRNDDAPAGSARAIPDESSADLDSAAGAAPAAQEPTTADRRARELRRARRVRARRDDRRRRHGHRRRAVARQPHALPRHGGRDRRRRAVRQGRVDASPRACR